MLTTYEMDGLFTDEDIANRFFVYFQCRNCSKWTMQDTRLAEKPCEHCGHEKFDVQSATSKRTFNPLNKRKIK